MPGKKPRFDKPLFLIRPEQKDSPKFLTEKTRFTLGPDFVFAVAEIVALERHLVVLYGDDDLFAYLKHIGAKPDNLDAEFLRLSQAEISIRWSPSACEDSCVAGMVSFTGVYDEMEQPGQKLSGNFASGADHVVVSLSPQGNVVEIKREPLYRRDGYAFVH